MCKRALRSCNTTPSSEINLSCKFKSFAISNIDDAAMRRIATPLITTIPSE